MTIAAVENLRLLVNAGKWDDSEAVANALLALADNRYFGNAGVDNGDDDAGVLVNHVVTTDSRYGMAGSFTLIYAPDDEPELVNGGPMTRAHAVGLDIWTVAGLGNLSPLTELTLQLHAGISLNHTPLALKDGDHLTIEQSQILRLNSPITAGFAHAGATVDIENHTAIWIGDQSAYGDEWSAILVASGNALKSRNFADDDNLTIFTTDGSDNISVGDAAETLVLNGTFQVFNGGTPIPLTDNAIDIGVGIARWRTLELGTSVKVAGNQVLGARRTGWTDQTASAARTDLGASPTTGQLASAFRALYDDLKAHGAIGN
jgi:hypothetical protein